MEALSSHGDTDRQTIIEYVTSYLLSAPERELNLVYCLVKGLQ